MTSPADCPTPVYHSTHRYCPSCSWTGAPAPAPLDIIRGALDAHQQDKWAEMGRVINGDCSSTGNDGYEPHNEPFTLHQARHVLAALQAAGYSLQDDEGRAQADSRRPEGGYTIYPSGTRRPGIYLSPDPAGTSDD